MAVFKALAPLVLAGIASAQLNAHLSEETSQAFDSYVRTAEGNMQWKPTLKVLKPGQIQVAPWNGAALTPAPDGLIHDWAASVEVPGATVDQTLHMFQNYADYPSIFGPSVIESKVLSHEGNRWKVYLRLKRKNLVTVVLDADYDIEYKPLGGGRWAIVSRSGNMSEIQDGAALPEGTGNGFLWRLNSYWLIEPRPAGVYVECRTISLSRDIPVGLGWLIKPRISNVPRDSLRETMEEVKRTLR
jgi:hypothetical protein